MKITYLFGAGASANCVPVVNGLKDSIFEVKNLFKNNVRGIPEKNTIGDDYQGITNNERELCNKIIGDFEWLLVEMEKHSTIDTLAKKYYIREEYKKLNKLKIVFSIYMAYIQSIEPYDKRYDTFFASIIKEKVSEFPNNIRILSWKYDNQFECALTEYSNSIQFETNSSFLNLVNKYDYQEINKDGFGILKINGSAALHDQMGFRSYSFKPYYSNNIINGDLSLFAKRYAAFHATNSLGFNGVSFAWEEFKSQSQTRLVKDTAKEFIGNTDVLVVIGYSFPFFNRHIDRHILEDLNLKKIYVQDKKPDAVKERIKGVLNSPNVLIEPIYNTDEFYIPYELDQELTRTSVITA